MNGRAPSSNFLSNQDLRAILPSIVAPFKEELISGLHYTIRVGDAAWVTATNEASRKKRLSVRRPLIIPAGREAVIRSWEEIVIPGNLLGFVEANALYAIRGLLVISSTNIMEPGENGHIFFTLSNIADYDITIDKGAEIGKLFLIQLVSDEQVLSEIKTAKIPPELPRIIDREFDTYPVLAVKVQELEEKMTGALRNDHLLLDMDLALLNDDLINPFEESNLQPDGYRLHLGNRADLFLPQVGENKAAEGRISKHISKAAPLIVPPNNTVVVRTLERVVVPSDISIILYPLNMLTKQYINFDGKTIPPGYQGYIWCNLHNYGTVDAEMKYCEPIAFAKFTRLGKETRQPYGHGRELHEYVIEEMPSEEVPEPPTNKWENLVSLTKKVEKLEEEVKSFGPTKTIIDLIFLAGVAGIIGGFALLVLPGAINAIPAIGPLDPTLIFAIVIVILVIVILLLNRRSRRK